MCHIRSNECRLACLQAVPLTATITYTDPNSAYMALQQALSAHSPAIVPPVAKPLVLVGPYGPACSKSALLERLLKKHGDVFACPQHITTQAQPAAVADGTEAASLALKVYFSQHGSRNCHCDAAWRKCSIGKGSMHLHDLSSWHILAKRRCGTLCKQAMCRPTLGLTS